MMLAMVQINKLNKVNQKQRRELHSHNGTVVMQSITDINKLQYA